jgi:hypothetical protein
MQTSLLPLLLLSVLHCCQMQDASLLGRRNFLTALGFLTTINAAQAAQAAADPYEVRCSRWQSGGSSLARLSVS